MYDQDTLFVRMKKLIPKRGMQVLLSDQKRVKFITNSLNPFLFQPNWFFFFFLCQMINLLPTNYNCIRRGPITWRAQKKIWTPKTKTQKKFEPRNRKTVQSCLSCGRRSIAEKQRSSHSNQQKWWKKRLKEFPQSTT